MRYLTLSVKEELVKLNKDTVAPLIKQLVQDIKDAHREDALQAFLTEVEEFVVANSDRFTQEQDEKPKVIFHESAM